MSISKVSISDVRGMFARYCRAVERAGVDVSSYYLREGDSVLPWRAECGGSGTIGTGSYGYLGDTRREAYRALYVMAQTLEDMAGN